MSSGHNHGGSSGLPPDAAFTVLGNETRIRILQVLGGADQPLSFTALRDQVGIRQGGQFNYHLDKLLGHFVDKVDEGYVLRQPGRRVVQAVLSGAVTANAEIELTDLDRSCWWCGAPIMMSYYEERVDLYCTGCDGTYGDMSARRPAPALDRTRTDPPELGFLGNLFLPPAGVLNRTPEEAYQTAWAWEMLEYLAIASDVCPRCSGSLDTSIDLCEHHDTPEGLCTACGNRQAINLHVYCPSCTFRNQLFFIHTLYNNAEFLDFLSAHNISPISPESIIEMVHTLTPFDEEIISTDPFEARFAFTADDESLSLIVDEELSVIEVTRNKATDTE